MTLTPKRLQRLVKHRERLERVQQQQLAEVRQQHQRRERALADTEARREQALGAGAPSGGPVDPGERAAADAYVVRLKREAGARRAALGHSAEAVERERRALMERRRDVRAIEALLDRHLRDEQLLRTRKEAQRLDETAARRWLDRGNRPAGNP